MAASQEKVAVYSLPDLKNTTDDAIPIYLNSLSFKQSHTLTDVRLFLSYLAFGICAATFYWDYKLGFEATKYYTAAAVALYTCINGLLTFWIWGVEKNTIYVGTNEAGDKISIQSSTKKHVPIYHLTITVQEKGAGGKSREIRIARPFREWFDKEGHFVTIPFQQMLASNVGVIGAADPKRVVDEKKMGAGAKADDTKSMEEKWNSLLAESSGATVVDSKVEADAASSATPGKGGKRRAKKA